MTISFLELTTYDENSAEGYDDTPSFNADIWPLLTNGGSTYCVYAWDVRARVKAATLCEYGEADLRNSETSVNLRELSSWGGHLNVLFEFRDTTLLSRLISMYRLRPRLSSEVAQLELSTNVKSQIEKSIGNGSFVLAFAHDGDPAYVFGDSDRIATLVNAPNNVL